jgi:cytochrome c oxidase subunit II
MLDAHGFHAVHTAELWWLALGAATAVFVCVVAALALAVFRPRSSASEDSSIRIVVLGGIVLPVVLLSSLFILVVRTLADLADPLDRTGPNIHVIGHQFWWEVRYPDQQIVTANEVHVPVGLPVRITLSSVDVIHSFWVPQLAGKVDLIPGHTDTTWLQADQPGVYRGQCAEYCGLQHARMAFLLVAEPPDAFAAWLEQQRRPADQPTDPLLLTGAQAFARAGCVQCHSIRYGDRAVGGLNGPDLTHIGSRRTIAAGTLPNNLGNLLGWITNPQALKPGNLMPTLPLEPETVTALAQYLESLK